MKPLKLNNIKKFPGIRKQYSHISLPRARAHSMTQKTLWQRMFLFGEQILFKKAKNCEVRIPCILTDFDGHRQRNWHCLGRTSEPQKPQFFVGDANHLLHLAKEKNLYLKYKAK